MKALGSKKDKFNDLGFLASAQEDITKLHLARSVAQFDVLGASMLMEWRLQGEDELADWFCREYLSAPYNRWSVSASGVPGNNPNQNAIESSHRNDKRHLFGQAGRMLKYFILTPCHAVKLTFTMSNLYMIYRKSVTWCFLSSLDSTATA
jgi:hypothetical protein